MDLEELAKACEKLRVDMLLGPEGDTPDILVGLSPEAEQFALLALTSLEQAQRYATLANYCLMQKR